MYFLPSREVDERRKLHLFTHLASSRTSHAQWLKRQQGPVKGRQPWQKITFATAKKPKQQQEPWRKEDQNEKAPGEPVSQRITEWKVSEKTFQIQVKKS